MRAVEQFGGHAAYRPAMVGVDEDVGQLDLLAGDGDGAAVEQEASQLVDAVVRSAHVVNEVRLTAALGPTERAELDRLLRKLTSGITAPE